MPRQYRTTTIQLLPETFDEIQAIAAKTDRTPTYIMRELIVEGLARMKAERKGKRE